MTTAMLLESNPIPLTEAIAYVSEGIRSTILLEDANCRYTVMALSAGMYIAEHASPLEELRSQHANCVKNGGYLASMRTPKVTFLIAIFLE